MEQTSPRGKHRQRSAEGKEPLDSQTLYNLRSYLEVAHHVPGRLRLKFSPTIVAAPGAADLARWAQRQKNGNHGYPDGLVNLRLNLAARSLIIEYNRKLVSPKILEELFRTQDKALMHDLVNQLADSLGLDN